MTTTGAQLLHAKRKQRPASCLAAAASRIAVRAGEARSAVALALVAASASEAIVAVVGASLVRARRPKPAGIAHAALHRAFAVGRARPRTDGTIAFGARPACCTVAFAIGRARSARRDTARSACRARAVDATAAGRTHALVVEYVPPALSDARAVVGTGTHRAARSGVGRIARAVRVRGITLTDMHARAALRAVGCARLLLARVAAKAGKAVARAVDALATTGALPVGHSRRRILPGCPLPRRLRWAGTHGLVAVLTEPAVAAHAARKLSRRHLDLDIAAPVVEAVCGSRDVHVSLGNRLACRRRYEVDALSTRRRLRLAAAAFARRALAL